MADLLYCMVETNKIIKQLYANKLKKKVCLHFCELIHKHGITCKNDSREDGWRSSEIPFMTNLIEILSHLNILGIFMYESVLW